MSLWSETDNLIEPTDLNQIDDLWEIDGDDIVPRDGTIPSGNTLWVLNPDGSISPSEAEEQYTVYNNIIERRQQYFINEGGNPHRYIELYGGKLVEILYAEPDIMSYRSDYYYNGKSNTLYIKSGRWASINVITDNVDDEFVYVNNVRISKLANEPNPKTYSNEYYYNIITNKIYKRILYWSRHTDGT